MPLTLLLALAAAAQPAPPARRCRLIYPVVPDERAARRIAEVVIAARPFQPRRRYQLRVTIDEDDPRQWLAYQHRPAPRLRLRPGEVQVTSGGGGVEMRIDRCTGAITHLHYIR